MNVKSLLLLGVFFVSAWQAHAQVNINYNNISKIDREGFFKKRYGAKMHKLNIPSKERILQKERQNEGSPDKQFLIAEAVPVDIDFVSQADWIVDGSNSYGKYTIHADSAKTLSINFDKFYLPEGTELYLYNDDGTMITGPVGSGENNENQIWGSAIFKGEDMNIEVRIPSILTSQLKLHISNVAYGYKQIFVDKAIGFGLSGTCNINVLCPLGNGWANERNSVSLITIADGTALCSGAMIANACNNNIPYLLTANHCYNLSPTVSSWRFQFQAWSPACTPNTNSNGILFNGATLRANYTASDFALVQLNQTPAANSGIQYAGWSRSSTPATSTTGIHHPRGDVMKISRDNNATFKADYLGGTNNTHWQIQWDNGVTETGSSGSPLFDQNHRIVGQLHGGYSGCSSLNQSDWYGAFDISWTGGGTNNTRLSNWLDPQNTGVMTLNTVNRSALANPDPAVSLSISGANIICTGSTNYTLSGAPVGSTIQWQSSNPAVATISGTGTTGTVTKVGTGTVTITARIANYCHAGNIATKSVAIGIPALTSYNPYIDVISFAQPVLEINDFAGLPPVYNPTAYYLYVDGTLRETVTSPSDVGHITGFSDYCTHGYYVVNIQAQTTCGVTPLANRYVYPPSCSPSITVTPNPANSQVVVKVNNNRDAESVNLKMASKKPISKNTITAIKILDGSGTVVKEVRYADAGQQVSIHVSSLIAGIYYFQVFNGVTHNTEKVVIQH